MQVWGEEMISKWAQRYKLATVFLVGIISFGVASIDDLTFYNDSSDDSLIPIESYKASLNKIPTSKYYQKVRDREYIPVDLLEYPVYYIPTEKEKAEEAKCRKWIWKESQNHTVHGDFIEEVIEIMVKRLFWVYRPIQRLIIDGFHTHIRMLIAYRQSETAKLCIDTYRRERKTEKEGPSKFISKIEARNITVDSLKRIGIHPEFIKAVKEGADISSELEEKMCRIYHMFSGKVNCVGTIDAWHRILSPHKGGPHIKIEKNNVERLHWIWELCNILKYGKTRMRNKISRIENNPYLEIERSYIKLSRISSIINEIWYFHIDGEKIEEVCEEDSSKDSKGLFWFLPW